MKKLNLVLVAGFVSLIAALVATAGTQLTRKPPLAGAQVLALLKNVAPDPRVAMLVKRNRVEFVLSTEIEEKVRQAGSGEELIEASIEKKGRAEPSSDPAIGTTKVNSSDGLAYVWIPPGSFQMGCSRGDVECNPNEKPARSVMITRGFWIGETLVTQAAYQRVMNINPSHFHGEQLPVEFVKWAKAKAYCEAVGGRLPTEAEWEYAARAGSDTPRYGELDSIAWYHKNSDDKTHNVREKQPNRWRLYDMLGNVYEWVSDWYDNKYDAKSPSVDPIGPTQGEHRVVRGGSFSAPAENVRASARGWGEPVDWGNGVIGFRCAREMSP